MLHIRTNIIKAKVYMLVCYLFTPNIRTERILVKFGKEVDGILRMDIAWKGRLAKPRAEASY